MLSARDVANFLIETFKYYEEDNDLTNMKINKLLYFAQGHSFERLGHPLFKEDFEAWDMGPVISTIYHDLKSNKYSAVTSPLGKFNQENFSDEEKVLLFDVIKKYGQFSAFALSDMTHQNGTPWKKNHVPTRNNTIPKEDIEEFFKTRNLDNSSSIDVSEIPVVGYNDEHGNLILPKEELDDWEY